MVLTHARSPSCEAHLTKRSFADKCVPKPELRHEGKKHLGVEIDELRLHKHTRLVGKTVAELQTLSEGHLFVLALQRADGHVLKTGFHEEKLQAGDSVIIIGRTHALPSALRGEVDREGLL